MLTHLYEAPGSEVDLVAGPRVGGHDRVEKLQRQQARLARLRRSCSPLGSSALAA
ncbi:hypothetical protein ACWEKT_35700 [Nocardia takedensis]